MQVLKEFFKQKETFIGMAVALLFPIIFYIVWLTAYDGVYERTDQMQVALVNEDTGIGNDITKQIKAQIPFEIIEKDLQAGKALLQDKEVGMMIHIPENMTQQLLSGEQASLNYTINQAVPMMEKQLMETFQYQLHDKVDRAMQKQADEQVVAEAMKLFSEEDAVSEWLETVQAQKQKSGLIGNVEKLYEKEGFAISMTPLLVVLAAFVGAMVMSMQFQVVQMALKSHFNEWQIFGARQVANIIVTIVVSLVAVLLMRLFDLEMENSLLKVWGFNIVLFLSFVYVSQLFVLLFGQVGMVMNIILMSTQLVTSGVLIPIALLSETYQKIGSILPATYGAEGLFRILYIGGSLKSEINTLLLITCVVVALTVCIVFVRNLLSQKALIED